MADFAAQDAPPGALNLVADSEAMLASGVFPEHKLCRGVFGKMGDVVDLGTLGDSGPQVSPSVNGVTRAMAGPLRSITSPRHHAFHSSSCHGPIFLFRKNLHLLSIIHFDHAPTHAHACTMHHAPCIMHVCSACLYPINIQVGGEIRRACCIHSHCTHKFDVCLRWPGVYRHFLPCYPHEVLSSFLFFFKWSCV